VREDAEEAAKAREELLSGAAGKAQTLTQKTSDWQPLNTTLQPENDTHTHTHTQARAHNGFHHLNERSSLKRFKGRRIHQLTFK